MPKVIGHTPAWLQRPSRGYELFAPKPSTSPAPTEEPDEEPEYPRLPKNILRKNIATRNTEIFVAEGNEIRWADLVHLKENDSPVTRILKVSVPLPIERLAISPYGDYLAVSTSHTVHIVVLPDCSLLSKADNAPIRPKTFQVGPTAHVLENSPIATVLWHPLGYHGRCLVTITKAGVVRLWEINRVDRSSFNDETLSIDLQKLLNAQNDEEDVSASRYGFKRFSPDSADLEVASACFGDSPENQGVHGWTPMTLWIATVSGDVYALCPLLPSKWQLVNDEDGGADSFKQTLISTINVNHADVVEESGSPPLEDMALADRQIKWLSDIIFREPFTEEFNGDTITIYNRPTSVPAVPLLQGPFSMLPEVEDFELSDMIVFSLKTFSDSSDEEIAEGLPSAVVCLLTDTCEVHVCLDLEGIIGRWLPPAGDEYVPPPEHVLAVVETITLAGDGVSSLNQSITVDVKTDFSFFVSHASGVFYVSLEPWIRNLESELYEAQSEGADFRLQRLLESAKSVAEKCVRRNPRDKNKDVTSCVVTGDGNVGYMVLTAYSNEPHAVILSDPDTYQPDDDIEQTIDWPKHESERREPWHQPKEFWQPLDLFASLQSVRRSKATWEEEIKLSPANLEILLTAHRVLADHTGRLQQAVSDLFNRCQRLQDEYRDQIIRTAQNMDTTDRVTGRDDAQNGDELYGNRKIDDRMKNVQKKQKAQKERYLELRRKMASINTTQLSDKEVQFVEELQTMEGSIDKSSQRLTDIDGSETPVWERMDKVRDMERELKKEVEDGEKKEDGEQRLGASIKVPSQSRKMEQEHIDALLKHQDDLLKATVDRLRDNDVDLSAAVGVDGS